MVYECIVFSDPRSTTRIQLATRDGVQGTYGAGWTGIMRFEKLKVFSAQNRNSTCTFNITSYNTADDIFSWMLPGIGVFVVHLGMLRFSGVITKVDGSYVGANGKQIFNITCESDAHYLMNYAPITNVGKLLTNSYPNTIIHDLVKPYNLWVDNDSYTLLYSSESDVVLNYRINDKPILTQIQEICQMTGCSYRTKTRSTLGTITRTGYNIVMNSTSPEGFLTLSSNLGWGSHNKYILVLIDDSAGSYHSCAMAVTATNSTSNSITVTATNVINDGGFFTGRRALLIQHPVVEIRRDFYTQASTPKTFYMSPSSNTYNTVCWDFNPLTEKNDTITKVIATGTDNLGNANTITLAAAYKFDPVLRTFLLNAATTEVKTTLPDMVNCADSVSTGKLLIYTDGLPSLPVLNDVIWVGSRDQSTSKYEIFQQAVTPIPTWDDAGKPQLWLQKNIALTNAYSPGDIISFGYVGGSCKIYVNSHTNIPANSYVFVGRERVYVNAKSSDARGNYLLVNRGYQLTSSKGYLTKNLAIPHKVGCPVMEGSYFDIDDYYSASPMATYGINTKTVTTNKVIDQGALELLAYNVLRNKCIPKMKGNLSCMIQALTETAYGGGPITPSSPGSAFNVNFFGTITPSGQYYQIMSMDMDFDTGTAVVQFGEYDIQLMQWLQQSGLDINVS